MAYRVALFVLCGVYAGARRTCCHGLVSVFAEVELLLVFVVVYTLDHLWPHQRRLCDDALQRDHVVELVGAECAWVARVFAEAANVGAVVYDIRPRLGLGAVGEGFDDTLEGAVECFDELEGLVQEAVGQLAVMCSDLIDADLEVSARHHPFDLRQVTYCESPLASIEHHQDVRTVAISLACAVYPAVSMALPSLRHIVCEL